jgi:putative hydrolase of the HAD superfamily
MVKGVFFDAGNTIIFPDYEIYRGIASSLGLSVTTDEVMAAEARARKAFDRAVSHASGTNVYDFWSIYYTPFYEHLGFESGSIPGAIEMTRAANDEGLGIWKIPVEGLDYVLDELELRELRTGIISNSDGRLEERLSEIGIRDRFGFLIDSAVISISKPDPGIFEEALRVSSLTAADTVYVGDYYAVDVIGARGIGMRPVLFDPYSAYGEVDCAIIRRFEDLIGLLDRWMEEE